MSDPDRGPARSSRREAILAASLELFRQRGFHAVGIDEIGQVAGITGPGVYRHFPSKDSLLVALFDQISAQMLEGAQKIAARITPAPETLRNLVELHVAFAVAERALLSVWVQDWRSLPDADRERIRGRQVEYMEHWAGALAGLRPELSRPQVDTVVWAAVGSINSVAFHDSGLEREALDPLLRHTALCVLGAVG